MDFEHPPADPITQFLQWLEEAGGLGLRNPNAMTLATVDPDGRPSARTVLLKSIDEKGAVFYTNSRSRKGRALAANPRAALLFHWDAAARQVCIEGSVAQVPDSEADAYFATRPRGAQIGAWASDQSEPVESRAALDERVARVAIRHAGRPVPRPPHWVGYRVRLQRIEFWQGRESRLHDRVVYSALPGGGWSVQRLCP
jgi:pyridoxamine 5'-phosphate oxidase